MASRQSISNFEVMDAVGTSLFEPTRIGRLNKKFILRIAPIYLTYLYF